VAHDLRAPLRSLEGFTQALIEDCGSQLDEDGKRYLNYIRESSLKMTQMVDGLLALSRVTRGELNPVAVNLSAVARKILSQLQASSPQRAVEIVIPDGITGQGDARMLTIALEHLLGNAWKFTRHQSAPQIEFGVDAGTPDAGKQPPVYFVRDNGAGFDEQYASKLFNVFQRLHTAEEFEGIGVGLAIVHRILGRHGGRAWAQSTVDQGATFYFTLQSSQ
jgi:light-regulated signal transduction histidine kinase (bacteriophytochrome)